MFSILGINFAGLQLASQIFIGGKDCFSVAILSGNKCCEKRGSSGDASDGRLVCAATAR